jgi:hypothetical protein
MMASPIIVRHTIDERARRPSVKLNLGMLPAAGTHAAVNWRDYGRSRWQLSDKITTIAGVHVRGPSSYFAARETVCGPLQMPRPPAVGVLWCRIEASSATAFEKVGGGF